MKLNTLLITTIGAFAIASANAGDYAPAVDAKTVLVEESGGFTGEFSGGYDTRYIYRGLWFGNDAIWGNISISKEIAPNLIWSANAYYTDITDNNLAYSEANLGTGLAYETDLGTFSAGFLFYKFFDGFAGNNPAAGPGAQQDATEINIGYSRELFLGITGSLLVAHDFRIDAQYFEAGIGKSWALCDTVSLDASAAVGYGLNDYYSRTLSGDAADGITHGLLSLALPVALAENVTLTPHASVNLSGDGRRLGNAASVGSTAFFYGVSFAVSF